MSNDFWSTLNKKKREELLKSTQTKSSSAAYEEIKTSDFFSALNEDKKREFLSKLATESAPTRTFMQDDDIAPVKGGNQNSIFKSGGFSDGVDGAGDFFLDLVETAAGTAGDLGMGVLKGVGRLAEGVVDWGTYGVAGVADLFGADEFADKTRKVAQYSATDEWTAPLTNWFDEYSILGNKADMVTEGLGQVLGIIGTGGLGAAGGLSSAGVSALTTGVTFASGMGSGMNEAYEMGATDGEAFAYGTTVGAVEAVSEAIFSGLGKGVKALGVSKGLTSIDDVAAKKISNIAAKFITSEAGQKVVGNTLEFAVKSSAEGLEEVISGVGSAIAKDVYLLNDEDEKAFGEILKDENLLEQFVVGSIVSGIAQGGDFIGSTKNGRDFVSGLSKNEQTVVDKVYEQRLAEESKKRNLTKRDKNKLYDRVVEDMKRGYVSTDEIEGILGGETYKGYKDLTDKKTSLETRKKAIEEEIKSLVSTPESQFTVEQREKLNSLREEAKNIDKSLSSLGIDTAKSNLFNEVDKLTEKDTFLRESYNERARRGQAFEADLTKYTGKQKEAVQRAIDSGVLNNTNRSHELVDTLSKIEADKGIVFDYTNNKKLKESGFAVEGKTVNGFVKDGGITLNVQSQKAWQSTVGHEISHVLEGTEAYGALREALYAYAESKGELESRKAELTELYNGMNADIDAELTADLIGDYLFTDKDFINRLTSNRNLFQKIYDEIKYLCKVATGKELTEIEKVKREFDRAWKEQGQIAQSEEYSDADDSGESDINYSISVTDKATRDFLDEQVAKGEYDAETNPDGGYYVTYKSMSFWGYDEDGNAILRSPMAEYVDGELSNAYLIPKDKSKLNWYKATETIDENTGLPSGLMVKVKKDGNKSFTYLPAAENQDLIKEDWSNLYFNLQKKVLKNGKWVNSDVPARYNPYEHSSNSMLNDQFSAAYLRDNLVTVKMYVPVSEDNGAYRAKWSKDPTGWSDWKTGTVAGKIGKQKDLQRKVYLSRYAAPVEIVPDSEVAQAYKEYLDGTDVTIPDNVVSPNLLNELKKAGVPITESGKVKYSLSEDIDKNGNLGYNGSDLYTTTDEFYLDVDKADRDAFPRSLANKTTGMEKDEIRTVEIYGAGKVYFFKATGYMQGQMLYSANIKDVYEYRTAKKEFLNGNNSSRQTFGSWASVLSLNGTGTRSDIHSIENGRAESNVYEVYGEPRTRNGTGTQERIGENFRDDPEEVKSVIKALREEYGFEEKHPTNEIAPIKEVSSTDDAFFVGEEPRYSLSTDKKKADADYSFAVNGGDTETAQRMVDEKAKENGYTVKAYHGTGRADRVGNVFLPERATSGPMAFFTDNKEIASNYARDKADTSLAYDEEYDSYYTQFRVNRNGESISIPELWKHLSVSERNRIKEQAGHIKFDDDYETIIVDESAQHGNGAWDAYTLNYHRGNALEALVDTWLESGDLYNQEELFLEVLKNVGITDAEYRNPDARFEKVYDTWLKIQNPFDTDNADQSFYDGLSEWIDNNDMSVYEKESADADMWDKNNQTPESWLGKLEGDIESGTTHAWTVIPDFVTDYLKAQGYDGIKDKGGKGGGAGHTVWIPFSSEQVKSAEPVTYDDNGKLIPLSQRFDSSKVDIRNSLSNEGEQFAPIGNYSTPLSETALEQDIAPVAEGVAENAAFDAPMLGDIPILPDEELEQGTIAAIRPKPEKQPSLKRVNNAESKEHIAQVLTEEPKVEKKKKGIFSTLVRNFVDKGAVFENLSLKTKNRALQYTYKAMGRSETKAQYFMENGTEGVKPLNDIIAEVEQTGKTKEFYEYLYHKHNVDRMSLESRERPNLERLTSKMNDLKLLNLQENQLRAIASEKITNETAPKRVDLITTVREYLKSKDVKNKPVFDYSVTADMSQETAKQYEAKNPEFKKYAQDVYDYMNHLRKMMVDKGVISQETADLWAKTYPYYVPLRRVGHEGSAVNVPLDTNKTGINAPIKRATGGNSDILPLFETMAQRTLQTFKAVDKNRFGVELKNALGGVTQSATTSLDEVIDSVDAHDSLLQEGENGKNPTFTVFEGGERVTFDITDEMYDALKPTSEGLSYTNKVLNTASNLHRGVLTEYSVPFMVNNAIKDAQDALFNSQHAVKTYAKFPTAIKELKTKGKWYTEYMENGGGDNTYFDKQTNTFNKEKSKARKIIGFPIDKISDANNFIEKVPRLAEYIASRESGASIDAAMLDAARVTTDFSAGGDVTKFLNRNGATFLNASVQGAAQVVRNVREAKMNGLKGWLGLATKCAVAGLPAMLLNGLFWDDDEDYEELSDYVKENYYIVGKYGDGKFVRIPKGRTVAVIQNAFEQISNALTGDDEVDFGRFAELAMSNLAPNNPIDNNIIAPIKQVMENKTWYGEDLVPTRLQDLPAAEQFDESTDAVSKWLGENLNVSPYKINYLLNQYSGGIGDIFLPMMTPEAESGDNSLLGNLIAPLKDKFTTDSVMNNQNVSDFYSKADELKVKANSSNATEEDILKNKYMNAVNSELGELYKAKREIQNGSLSDDVKYAQVRAIQKQINALAKESLNTYDNVVSEDNYAKVGDKHYKQNDEGEWQKINDKQVEKQAPFVKVYGGYSSYLKYSSDLYDIKADKDEYGKSISGSRKEKVLNYINNLDADYETKIILWKSEYPSDDTYNMDIINYLNNRADLTYEERVAILTELGFTVSGDTVYWD